MKPTVQPVILCGGSGTRLWPSSRQDLPKQFIELMPSQRTSLFLQAMHRVHSFPQYEMKPPVVVASDNHRFIIKNQIIDLGSTPLVFLEPNARNTAPALTMAALAASPDDILIVLTKSSF